MESDNKIAQDAVKELFSNGLQEMISILNCIYIAVNVNRKNVPTGFCGRVEKAFTNPVLGGLYDLLLWLVSITREENGQKKLSHYLLEEEKKGKGWIGLMVQLRNKYQHPKEETPEEIIDKASQLLSDMFKFDYFGNFMMEEKVYWDRDCDKMCLYPFVLNDFGEMLYLKEINDKNEFVYFGDSEVSTHSIKEFWSEIRILDKGLTNPTAKELLIKGRNNFTPISIEKYWWYEKLLEKKSVAYFIEKDLSEHILSHIHSNDKETIPICIILNATNIMETVCKEIGIEPLSKLKDFCSTFKDSKLSIALKANELKAKEFIFLVDWMKDAVSNLNSGKLKIFVEREKDILVSEQEKISDHISDMGSIFEKPPHSKGNDITSFIWSRELKKKTFGIF